MKDETKQIISNIVGSTLRKKLQERVLEIAGKGKGRTTPDMIDLVDLAKEIGDEDSLWVLNEKFREIGEIQSRRNLSARKNRKTKDEKERRLEDYVQRNSNLIEEGLEFVSRQDVLHSGRTDVIAQDKDGKEVVIELKATGYDAGDVFHQISRYAGEKDDSRIIFAAPEIDPQLYFAIKSNPALMERTEFRVVEENDDGTFSFIPFLEDMFGETPEHAKYDFANGNRRKEVDEDTVEVVKPASKPRGVREREKKRNEVVERERTEEERKSNYEIIKRGHVTTVEDDEFIFWITRGESGYSTDILQKNEDLNVTKEDIEQRLNNALESAGFPRLVSLSEVEGEEDPNLDSYPLFYQVMSFNRPGIDDKNRRKYLEGEIQITQKQKEGLEKLLVEDSPYKEIKSQIGDETTRTPHIVDFQPNTLDSLNAASLAFDKKLAQYPIIPTIRTLELVLSGIDPLNGMAKDLGIISTKLTESPEETFDIHDKSLSREAVEAIGEQNRNLHQIVERASYSDEAKLYRRVVNGMINNLSESDSTRKLFEELKSGVDLKYFKAFKNFVGRKIARFEALSSVDRNLAFTYFFFGRLEGYYPEKISGRDISDIKGPIVHETSDGGSDFTEIQDFIRYSEVDDELYRSIMDSLHVVPEPIREKVERPESIESPRPKPERILTPEDRFMGIITGQENGSARDGYTPDMLARIGYFADEMVTGGLNGADLKELGESVYGVLHARVRKHETLPRDVVVRTFLDDVILRYVRTGNVPDKKRLEEMYLGVEKEFPKTGE